MTKISLDRAAIRRLGFRAEQENKLLLLAFIRAETNNSIICFQEKSPFVKLRTLAGDVIYPFNDDYNFLLDFGKIFGWEIYQASKEDLLMNLDRPINHSTITKILSGTLQVLE